MYNILTQADKRKGEESCVFRAVLASHYLLGYQMATHHPSKQEERKPEAFLSGILSG